MNSPTTPMITFTVAGKELALPDSVNLTYRAFKAFLKFSTVQVELGGNTQEALAKNPAKAMENAAAIVEFIDILKEDYPGFADATSDFALKEFALVIAGYMGLSKPDITPEQRQGVLDILKKA